MYTKLSQFLALILRHHPEKIGISLDEHGWANVDELIEKMSQQKPITREILDIIVATDNKNRYSFNEDKTLIRANQGHSIAVDVQLEVVYPDFNLYHGTGLKYTRSIEEIGLISKNRLYVHLSKDISTAINVGKRHGIPVVYEVDTQKLLADGYTIYKSVNGVYLVKEVPLKYLKRI